MTSGDSFGCAKPGREEVGHRRSPETPYGVGTFHGHRWAPTFTWPLTVPTVRWWPPWERSPSVRSCAACWRSTARSSRFRSGTTARHFSGSDALGVPKVRVHWTVGVAEERTNRRSIQILLTELDGVEPGIASRASAGPEPWPSEPTTCMSRAALSFPCMDRPRPRSRSSGSRCASPTTCHADSREHGRPGGGSRRDGGRNHCTGRRSRSAPSSASWSAGWACWNRPAARQHAQPRRNRARRTDRPVPTRTAGSGLGRPAEPDLVRTSSGRPAGRGARRRPPGSPPPRGSSERTG